MEKWHLIIVVHCNSKKCFTVKYVTRIMWVENLPVSSTVQLEKLSDMQCQPESQLKFITDAWLQVS